VRGWGLALAVLLLVTSVGVAAAPAVAATSCRAGYVALTFDDGPRTGHTAAVLDVLAEHQVPATFFVIGQNVDARPSLVVRADREGHALANHTYAHERLTSRTDAVIRDTVERTDRAIRRAGVTPLRLVRPPFGATDGRVRDVLRRAGYGHITWTVDPQDWRSTATATSIRRHVLDAVRDGSVILLHDGSANAPRTIEALPGIVRGIRERGLCFALLDDVGHLIRGDGGPFRDVPPDSTHAVAIARLAALGVTEGCGEGRYCPDEVVTRAQMASFLTRAFALPPGPGHRFVDVEPTATHAASIDALFGAGITRGCTSDGRSYCPVEAVPRDQMASFLARTLDLPPGEASPFGDVVEGSTHAAAIAAVHTAGITAGCTPDGRDFCPSARVTRAQMASFLVRAVEHGRA
jgi:peptidoglycan/xylan/chitin deacetylase (PgdA/CDA1 family)